MLLYLFNATKGQFATLYCYMFLINNQKLIYIKLVYEAFIISKMAIVLSFEVMFDSVAVLKLDVV
jgi:hypothetical protein